MSESRIVRTTCSYCSVGCAIDIQIEDGKAVKVLPAKDYPVNKGRTCTKGFNLLKAYESPDRGLHPMLRDSQGIMQPVSWDQAANEFANRFKDVQRRHGTESVAFLGTGQLPFEESAFLGVFAKFGMGLRHGDGNTRQCMASAAVAYKQSFGFDAPPFTYQDAEESDLLVFIGANPVIAHPIFWQRIKNNTRGPTVVCIDPRRTETAREATLHLAIQPKSDLVLLYAIANRLIERGAVKQEFVEAHTSGFAGFAAHVREFTLETAAAASGIPVSRIEELVTLIIEKERVSFWWTMGVNQSQQGVRTAQAIINICLMTGNIGRPGTGPNSITGQTNAMGSRLFSNTTSLLGGHDYAKPEHRSKVSQITGFPENSIPTDAGMAYDQILDGIDTGTIKGLWIVCTNPAHSWIDKHTFFDRMKKLEFLVVQDIYGNTETAQIADLYLPAAGSTEKDGTMINSERRMGVVQKVMEPPGEALSDFAIIKRLATAWGCAELFRGWTDPQVVFGILRELSRGMPHDFTGIQSRNQLLAAGGIQWPFPETATATNAGEFNNTEATNEPGQRRLFADGRFFHADGKAKFLYAALEKVPEIPDESFPFWLLTGRGSMHQWHTQTRTGKITSLKSMYPAECYVEINPDDAMVYGISDKDMVRVTSRRSCVQVRAAIKDSVAPGNIFMAMHYVEVNFLTYPSFDSLSRQPSYKIGGARIQKVLEDELAGCPDTGVIGRHAPS